MRNKPVSILYEYIVTTVSYHLSVETTNIVRLAFTILNCDCHITSNPDFFKIRVGGTYMILLLLLCILMKFIFVNYLLGLPFLKIIVFVGTNKLYIKL